MAILSKVKSAVKKAASKVVSTAKNIFSGASSPSLVASVGQGLSPVQKATAQATVAKQSGGTYGGSTVLGQYQSKNIAPTGGQGFYSNPANYSTPAPRTVSSGSTPLRTTANTSSSAFDTGYGLSSNDIASITTPRNYTVDSGSLGSGGATSLTGASAVLPSAPSTPDYSGDIASINASLGVGITPPVTTTPTETNPQSSFDAYLKQQEKDQSKYEADTAKALKQARQDAGIVEAQTRVQNTQNQINAITGQMNADILKLRGTAAKEGVTEAVYGGQQAEVTREATIKLLPLQAQLAADQGNLEQAEDNLNTLYSLYSKQVESRYNFRKQVLDKTYDFFTAAEKRKLDQQDKIDQFKIQRFNDQNDFLQNAALQALKDGNTLLFNNLTRIQLPTNYTSPDWERQMQNVMNDASKVMAKYGGVVSNVNRTVNGKPQTAAQITANGYADRLNQADVIINTLGSKFTGKLAFGGSLPNVLQSSDRQSYEQAKRNFINAVLRRESGAAIAESEFDSADKQYFPQAGDSAQVVTQKEASRNTAINNIYREANVLRPVLPGQVITDNLTGKRYRIDLDGETLIPLK